MDLTNKGLEDKEQWLDKGYQLPQFDRAAMVQATHDDPQWIHFGAGNIFRAFQANAMQKLLNKKLVKAGLIAVDGFDYEIITKQYRPHDNLSILVTLKADGSIEKTVIGSIGESDILDTNDEKEYNRLKEIFTNPSLQMASFTITEKGYALMDAKKNVHPDIAKDIEEGPSKPQSYLGKVASLLYARYQNGALPIAMVSMDNCSKNGDKLFNAIDYFAKNWVADGKADKGFQAYIEDPHKVSFPWSMIDKITPRPDASVSKILAEDGLDLTPVITSKNTYIAPFVNSEESEYLVIEDNFPNGRPPLEEAGLLFTDRETVSKCERMKVCTCLNPLHTALAVFGCLLDYNRIYDEMKDEDLVQLIKTIGYKEGLPAVTDPKVLNPKDFIDTVINKRLVNPFMPDTPQRIATDTSQKLSIRYGETIKFYLAHSDMDVHNLKAIPFVFAGWLRYLTGIDDQGNHFELSPDPLLPELKPYIAKLHFNTETSTSTLKEDLLPLLKNKQIFGVDLTETGLDEVVLQHLQAMLAGPGAIRKELHKEATNN